MASDKGREGLLFVNKRKQKNFTKWLNDRRRVRVGALAAASFVPKFFCFFLFTKRRFFPSPDFTADFRP